MTTELRIAFDADALKDAITINYGTLTTVLTTLLATVDAQGAAVAALQQAQEKAVDAAGVEALEARVRALEDEVAAARSSADAAARKADAAAARAEKAEAEAKRVAGQAASLEAVVAPLAADVSNVVELAAAALPRKDAEGRFTALSSASDAVADRLADLAAALPASYASKGELAALAARVKDRPSPAPDAPEVVEAAAPGVGGEAVDALAGRVARLEARVGDVDVGALRDDVGVNDARLAALKAVVAELEAKMAVLGEQMAATVAGAAAGGATGSGGEASPAALAALAGDVSKLKLLRPELDTLKHSLGALRASLSDVASRQTEVESLQATLEATLKNLDALASRNADGLAALRTRVDALSASAAPLAALDALRANVDALKAMVAAASGSGAAAAPRTVEASAGADGAAVAELASRVAWLEARAASHTAAAAGSGGGRWAGATDGLVKYRLDTGQETDELVVFSPLNALGDIGLAKEDLMALLEPLAGALDDKADVAYVDEALNELDSRLRALAEFASDKLEALAAGLRSRASVKDMQEMEEDLTALLQAATGDGNYASAGRLHFRCLSCNRSTATVSGPASALYTRSLSRTAAHPRPATSMASSSFSRAPARPATSAGLASASPAPAGGPGATQTALYPVPPSTDAPMALFGTDHRVYHGRSPAPLPPSSAAARPTPSRTILNRPPLPPAHGVPSPPRHHPDPDDVISESVYEIQ